MRRENRGRDTVNVPAGDYILSIDGIDEEANATGDLDITEQADIVGAGAHTNTVDAAGMDRVFNERNSGDPTVISGLTITDGNISGNSSGVLSETAITLGEGPVVGNEAKLGGGVNSAEGQSLLIERSTISNNVAHHLRRLRQRHALGRERRRHAAGWGWQRQPHGGRWLRQALRRVEQRHPQHPWTGFRATTWPTAGREPTPATQTTMTGR